MRQRNECGGFYPDESKVFNRPIGANMQLRVYNSVGKSVRVRCWLL